MKRIRLSVGSATLLAALTVTPALSHDWYPADCCHGQDCAEVEKVTFTSDDPKSLPTMVVQTKFGTASVPRYTEFKLGLSPDGKMHACIVNTAEGMYLRCLFMPKGS